MSANSHTNTIDIDVAGTLQGLLDLGFNLRACDGEMNDNALDASAKNLVIDIYPEKKIIIYSDDGNGMNKQELEASCVLYTFELFKWNKIHSKKTKLGLFVPL